MQKLINVVLTQNAQKHTMSLSTQSSPIQQLAGSLLSPLPPDSDIMMRAPGQCWNLLQIIIIIFKNNKNNTKLINAISS